MLILKAFVNKKQIDEIRVHNIGSLLAHQQKIIDKYNLDPHDIMLPDPDIYEYKIEKPKGVYKHPILHKRSDGWQILAAKVLRSLNKLDPNEIDI